MSIVNTDALYHRNKSPDKFLHTSEMEKKKNFLDSLFQQHCHFSPFVVSLDGLLGVEAEATLKRIASRLAKKGSSHTRRCTGKLREGWPSQSNVAITLVGATHRFVWDSQLPAHKISVQRPQCMLMKMHKNQKQDENFIVFPPSCDNKKVKT